jgi:hypothetical protein
VVSNSGSRGIVDHSGHRKRLVLTLTDSFGKVRIEENCQRHGVEESERPWLERATEGIQRNACKLSCKTFLVSLEVGINSKSIITSQTKSSFHSEWFAKPLSIYYFIKFILYLPLILFPSSTTLGHQHNNLIFFQCSSQRTRDHITLLTFKSHTLLTGSNPTHSRKMPSFAPMSEFRS